MSWGSHATWFRRHRPQRGWGWRSWGLSPRVVLAFCPCLCARVSQGLPQCAFSSHFKTLSIYFNSSLSSLQRAGAQPCSSAAAQPQDPPSAAARRWPLELCSSWGVSGGPELGEALGAALMGAEGRGGLVSTGCGRGTGLAWSMGRA